jgi:hypothetical protein
MVLQAHEYESAQGLDLDGFFQSTKGKFTTDIGKAWVEEIYRRRQARKGGEGKGAAAEGGKADS